jgi:hypothetical protein
VLEPLGAPPKKWGKPEKDIWNEVSDLTPDGVATRSDRLLVEILVQLLLRVREDPGRLNPATAAQIRACLCALGMTPADRARLVVPQIPEEDLAAKYCD